jgi:hypothetical protein
MLIVTPAKYKGQCGEVVGRLKHNQQNPRLLGL